MTRLFVRLTSPPARPGQGVGTSIDYLVRDENGLVEAEGQTDAEGLARVVETAAPWADDPAKVVVLVPASDVLSASCEVPGRNAAQMRRAVPYAVEEFVADDIDRMQVACADPVRNEPVHCLVAPRSSIEDWLAILAGAGIQPGFLTVDAMALAEDAATVSVLFEHGDALIRASDQMACVDLPNLAAVLRGVADGTTSDDPPPVLRLVNGETSALGDLDLDGFEVEEVAVATSVLGFLAAEFDARAVNLLQGDYAVRRRPTGAWSRWRPVAAAAGIWFGVGLAVLAAQGFWADYRAAQFRQQAVDLYRALYGVDRVTSNPAARMRRMLGQTSGTQGTFHGLTGQFGFGLSRVSGQYELRGLTYSPNRGLDAEMILSNDAALEALGASFRSQGLDMTVISTQTAPGGRIDARVRVSRG